MIARPGQGYQNPMGRPQVPVSNRNALSSHDQAIGMMVEEDANEAHKNIVASSFTTAGTVVSVASAISGGSQIVQQNIGWDPISISLDSARKKRSTVDTSRGYQFDFPTIRNKQEINNVTKFRLNTFWLPQVHLDESLHPSFYFDQKIGVLIDEFNTSANTYQTQTGPGYHFDCDVQTPEATGVLCVPANDTIVFSKPVVSVSSLTFRFFKPSRTITGSCVEELILPKTVVIVRLNPSTNPATFVVVNDSVDEIYPPALITLLNNPSIAVQFTTTNDPTEAPYYNNQSYFPTAAKIAVEGSWYASSMSSITNGFTVLGLDASTVLPPPIITGLTGYTFYCTIMPNRVNLNMTFLCQTGSQTNNLNAIMM